MKGMLLLTYCVGALKEYVTDKQYGDDVSFRRMTVKLVINKTADHFTVRRMLMFSEL